LNRARLIAQLDASFPTEIVLLHGSGGVFAGQQPVDLDDAVRAACNDEDEYDEYASEDFESLGLELLLSLDWDGAGPGLSSAASLELLRLEPHKPYVVFRDEAFGLRVFAAVSEPLEMFLPRFVETFFGSNGTTYGAAVISSIPATTLNSRPDLIPERSVRDGYRDFLDWATEHLYGGWDSFDPLDWADQVGEDGPTVDDLQDRLDEASPEQEKEILLDMYFRLCYEESR
jgi:hypothetical protein